MGELVDLAAYKKRKQEKEEIEKLKRERDKTVAKIKDGEARKQIQEQLDGLSIDDDVKALENVREYADKVSAEVQIHDELKEGSVENKLAKKQHAKLVLLFASILAWI